MNIKNHPLWEDSGNKTDLFILLPQIPGEPKLLGSHRDSDLLGLVSLKDEPFVPPVI